MVEDNNALIVFNKHQSFCMDSNIMILQNSVNLLKNNQRESDLNDAIIINNEVYAESILIDKHLQRPSQFKEGTLAKKIQTAAYNIKTHLDVDLNAFQQQYCSMMPFFIKAKQQIYALGKRTQDLYLDDTTLFQPSYLERELKITESLILDIERQAEKFTNCQPSFEYQLKIKELKSEIAEIMPYYTVDQINQPPKYAEKRLEIAKRDDELMKQMHEEINKFQIELDQKKIQKQDIDDQIHENERKVIYFTEYIKNLEADKQLLLDSISGSSQNQKDLIQAYRQKKDQQILKIEEQTKESIERNNQTLKKIEETILQQQELLFQTLPQQNKNGATKPVGISFHLIFVIDGSGSIEPHFPQIKSCFNQIIESRKFLNKDKVSVIVFDTNAKVYYQGASISQSFDFTYLGGGTNFDNAFTKITQLHQLTNPTQQGIIIFLTDGQAPYQNSEQILKKVYQDSIDINMPLWMFTIGFSQGYNRLALETLTKAGNGGQIERFIVKKSMKLLYDCQDKAQLVNAFQEIQSQCAHLDSQEAFLETLKERKIELQNSFYQEEMNHRARQKQKIEQQEQEYQNHLERLQNSSETSQEIIKSQINKIQNQIEEEEAAREKYTNILDSLKAKAADLDNSIKSLNDLTSHSRVQKELEYFKSQKDNIEQLSIEQLKEIEQKQIDNGYVQDRAIVTANTYYVNKIFDVDSQIQTLKAKIVAQQNMSIKSLKDIQERMLDHNKVMNTDKSAELTCLKILKDNDILDKEIKQYNSTHMQKLIRFMIQDLNKNNGNRITEEHVGFFLQYLTELNQLIEVKNVITPNQIEDQRLNDQEEKKFITNILKPFINKKYPVPEFDKGEGTLQQQSAFLKKKKEELIESNKFDKFSNMQFGKAMLEIKIQMDEQKLAKAKQDFDFDAEVLIANDIKESNERIARIEAALQNPLAEAFSDIAITAYKNLRSYFSRSYYSYVYHYPKWMLFNQYDIMKNLVIPDLEKQIYYMQILEGKYLQAKQIQ